ncbi:hypothetical protein BGZ83_012105 [Gryganskiella cystojenkinii]|nr:hypothetical protein BGZ83_012105 [Gryganskiella cystojenkinii]
MPYEEQKEFTTDMYVAMRNRIFELEAKTVNYAPFNRASQKRPVEPSWISDDYQYTGPHQRQRGHDSCSMDADTSHPSKRPAYHHITHHHPPHPEHLPVTANAMGSSGSVRAYQGLVYKHISSYPSWYAPEAYISHHRPYSSQLPTRYPQTIERELEQQHRQPRTCKVQASLAYQEQEIPSASGRQSPVSIVHSPPKPTRRPSTPSNHPTQPQVIQPRPILPNMETTVHTNSNRSPPSHPRSHPSPQGAASAAAAAAAQQRQSFHQRQHRAQQQAQSDYSRSYHLQKHMRMMDQKRASQLAQQQQQQQQSHTAIFMSNQRHYQPHQQMYSSSSVKPTATLQPHSGASSLQTISQQQAHQHRLMQHQQQRQLHLQLQQQQARQLQYLRQRGLVNGSTASPASDSPKMAPASSTPSLKVTRSEPSPAIEPKPVPPFKVNFLRKIHCRFKKELQEVRFQGWQDAQVLEIEDQIALQDFESVFEGLDGNILASTTDSLSDPTDTVSETNLRNLLSPVMEEREDRVVIKIEDSDEEGSPLIIKSPSRSAVQEKVKDSTKHTFQNEASVGELFGHRWKTEPMVGYTLVQFGGTDRTRMVPMNPTVPSLTVTFNAVSESITFAFRVLVNGLCLLTSGGGPPALHMPEVSDESEDSDRDEELQESNPNEKDTARAGSPTKSPVEAEDIPTTIDKQKTDLGE